MEFKVITGGLARNVILIFDDRVSKHSFLAQLMAPEILPLSRVKRADESIATQCAERQMSTKTATGDLDAACYRAADEKKT